METRTKVVGGTISVGVIVAVLGGALQVQNYTDKRYHLRQEFLAASTKQTIQSINVQIVQIEIQLDIIESRKYSRQGDKTRHARLLEQLKELEKAKAELLRK